MQRARLCLAPVMARHPTLLARRLFMENNTEKRIENPYIPMAFEALST